MSTEIAQVHSVFITGIQTTVGQALALKLRAAGHVVAGTVSTSQEAARIRRFGVTPAYAELDRAGELRSAIQGTGAKIVINCASQIPNHVPYGGSDWDLPMADYAEALAEAAVASGVEYLLHTSYLLAGGHATDETEGAEDTLLAAQAAENIILTSSLPAAVVRLGYAYGPSDTTLEVLRDALRVGRPLDAGEEEVKAGWIYSTDAGDALVKAITLRPAGVTLEILDDHPLPPAEFIRLFARLQALGVPGRIPLFFRRALTSELQRQLTKVETHPSNAAAREALGWSPRYPNAEAGIEDLLLVWRAAMGAQA